MRGEERRGGKNSGGKSFATKISEVGLRALDYIFIVLLFYILSFLKNHNPTSSIFKYLTDKIPHT